jgi:hypothetical protein
MPALVLGATAQAIGSASTVWRQVLFRSKGCFWARWGVRATRSAINASTPGQTAIPSPGATMRADDLMARRIGSLESGDLGSPRLDHMHLPKRFQNPYELRSFRPKTYRGICSSRYRLFWLVGRLVIKKYQCTL